MPFDVEMPDGTVIEDVPDGTTKAQLLAKVQRSGIGGLPARPSPPPEDPHKYDPDVGMNPLEKLAVGAGAAVARAGRGLGHLLPAWKDDPRLAEADENAAIYEKHHPGGWATAGEVAGDVAMSALPLGVVNKGAQAVRAASMLPRAVGRLAPAVADVAANAGYSAATTPDDRENAALYGGAGALGGRVLTRALGGAVRPSAAAQELMDKGVRLTPGQAGEGVGGTLAGTYERALTAVPVIGRPVEHARLQALQDWQKVLANKVRPEMSDPGLNTLGDVKTAYRKAYQEALPQGMVIKPTDNVLDSMRSDVASIAGDLPPSARGKFDELTEWIGRKLEEGVPAEHWKETISKEVAGAIKAAKRDGQNSLVRALSTVDKRLDEMVPGRSLADIDRGYRQFQVLKKAGERASAIKRGGAVTPDELLLQASKAGAPTLEAAARQAQPILTGSTAATGMDKLGNMARAVAVGAVGHGVAGTAAVPIAAVSLLGATETGKKVLLGQYPIQRWMTENPHLVPQLTRALAVQDQQR